MSYPLILYELRYVHSPVVPGLTSSNHSTKVEGEFEVPVDREGTQQGSRQGRWLERAPIGGEKASGRRCGGHVRLPLLLAPGRREAPPLGRAEVGREVAGGEGGISCAVIGKSGERRRACAAPKVLLLAPWRRVDDRRGAPPVGMVA
jgi:hypothetical protein